MWCKETQWCELMLYTDHTHNNNQDPEQEGESPPPDSWSIKENPFLYSPLHTSLKRYAMDLDADTLQPVLNNTNGMQVPVCLLFQGSLYGNIKTTI